MMRNVDHLLVLFHDRKKASQKALSALEDIDDDCDDLGISFVEVVSNSAHIVIRIFRLLEIYILNRILLHTRLMIQKSQVNMVLKNFRLWCISILKYRAFTLKVI